MGQKSLKIVAASECVCVGRTSFFAYIFFPFLLFFSFEIPGKNDLLIRIGLTIGRLCLSGHTSAIVSMKRERVPPPFFCSFSDVRPPISIYREKDTNKYCLGNEYKHVKLLKSYTNINFLASGQSLNYPTVTLLCTLCSFFSSVVSARP